MALVECISINKQKILIPKEKLIYRPSAYAIITLDDKILLVKVKTSQKYYLPGGGVQIDEYLETALKREVIEETGLEIEIQNFIAFKETFFYYDPKDEAYHTYMFYYRCKPLTFDLATGDGILDDAVEKSCWVPMASLKPEDFHGMGEFIVELLQKIKNEK